MARGINKLSAMAINNLTVRGRHGDGGGLWLNVTSSGSKSWVFRWTKNKYVREMGLGSYPEINLAAARKKAFEYRQLVASGVDPKTERDKDDNKSFGDVADEYIESMQSRWTNSKTKWQWENSLVKACSTIRKRPIASIETQDILSILKPIWQKTPETASRVRMRVESVIDFASAKGIRSGDNPARWKGHLENILPRRDKSDKKHHSAMSYNDLPKFYKKLSNAEALAARALELLILTACRSGEVLKAEWTEVNFDDALWIIPKERMKAKRDHRIPLSEKAVSILKPLYATRTSNLIFQGQKAGKPLSSHSMIMLMRRLKSDQFTVHGFRSTFRDWCGDKTTFPREIAEAALAHQVGSEVEQAYRRSDALEKRRQLMQAWSDYCIGTETGNVVKLHG